MAYIEWDKILKDDSSTVSTEFKAIAEQLVKTMLLSVFNSDFEKHTISTSSPELHDIGNNQATLILKNFPVITFTELKDNVRDDDNVTALVENTDFVVDYTCGIVKIAPTIEASNLLRRITTFTVGPAMVSVAYVYGYESIPDDIQGFINVWASQLYKTFQKTFQNINDAVEIEMADYRKKIGTVAQSLLATNTYVMSMLPGLKSNYANYVELGTKPRY